MIHGFSKLFKPIKRWAYAPRLTRWAKAPRLTRWAKAPRLLAMALISLNFAGPAARGDSTYTPELHLDLLRLIYRAQSGTTTPNDLQSLERRFLTWKDLLAQEILASPREDQARLIESYFQELATLIQLRISLNLPHGPTELSPFYLHFTNAQASQLHTDFAPTRHTLAGQFFQSESTLENGQLTLKPSAEFILGLELAGLSSGSLNSQNLLTVVQYLGVESALQNLAQIKVLKSNHQVVTPNIPQSILDKLPALGTGLTRQTSFNQNLQRQWIAQKATEFLPRVATSFWIIKNSRQAQPYVQVLCSRAPQMQECASGVEEALVEAQTNAQVQASLVYRLETHNLEATDQNELSPHSLSRELNRALIRSKKQLLQTTLAMIITSPLVGQRLAPGSTDQLLALVDASAEHLAQSIPPSTSMRWAGQILRQSERHFNRFARERFASQLVAAAHELGASPHHPDPLVLLRVFSEQIAELNLNNTHLQSIFVAQRSYSQTRTAYRALLNSLTGQHAGQRARLPEGAPNDALGAEILRHHRENLDAQLTGLRALGNLMGFSGTRLELDEDQNESYREYLREELLRRNPLLAREINGTPLAQVLTQLHPALEWTPQSLARVTPALDQILNQLEAQNHTWIEQIGQAQQLIDLKAFAQELAVQELLMQGSPALVPLLREEIENWNHPSFFTEWMERQIGPVGHHSFTILCLIDLPLLAGHFFGGAPGRTISRATRLALGPVLKGLLYAGTLVAGIELVRRGTHLAVVSQETRMLQAGYSTSMLDAWAPLITSASMTDQEARFDQEKWSFLGHVVLDGLLLLPTVTLDALSNLRSFRRTTPLLETLRDFEAFAILENPTHNLSLIESNLAAIRARARANPTPGTELRAARAELAYQRLISRQSTGSAGGGP